MEVPILQEKSFDSKFSGNEVYYTAYSLLVTLKNSCGKLHCKKVVFNFLFTQDSEPPLSTRGEENVLHV